MPTAIRHWIGALVSFALLAASSAAIAEEASYEYDAAGRLALENVGDVWITYTFDTNGGLLGRTACEGDCFIEDICYTARDASVADVCLVCDPLTDRRAWTSDPNAIGCTGGDMGAQPDMGGPPPADMGGQTPDMGGSSPDSGEPNPEVDGGAGGGVGGQDKGGCNCSVSNGAPDGSLLVLLAFVLLGHRRRKRRSAKWSRRSAATVALLGLLVPGTASAQLVCKDGSCPYQTIADAIRDSGPNTTITIKPDTYYESNLYVLGGRSLVSTSPNDATSVVIDAERNGPHVLQANRATFRGIRFINGYDNNGNGGSIEPNGPTVFENVIFENNEAGLSGGAIGTNVGGLTITVINATFRNNKADNAGALFGNFDSLTIQNSRFENNLAADGGGGAVVSGGGVVTIKDSVFSSNTATHPNFGRGGAMVLAPRVAHLKNLQIDGNRATSGSNPGQGGAISIGGFNAQFAYFDNVSITNNQAGRGGGLHVTSVSLFLNNTTVSGNTVPLAGDGGGIYCASQGIIAGFSGTLAGNTVDQTNCGSCSAGATQACTTGSPAPCDAGSQTCGASGLWGTCVGTVTPATRETMCMDGIDEDCDGATDNDDYDCKYAWPGTRGQLGGSGERGDPVSTFTGEFFTRLEPDLIIRGGLPVIFTRYYASGLETQGLSGSLGTNWRHTFEWSMTQPSGGETVFTSPEGRVVRFLQGLGGWELTEPLDVPFELLDATYGMTLYDPRTDLRYSFVSGNLERIWDRAGNANGFTYAAGRLATVTNSSGTLTFSYDVNGGLQTVSDGTRTVTFGRTASDLTTVTDALGNDTTYTYGSGGLLNSVTMPEGNATVTHTWHADGRLATQADALGKTTSFAYDDNAIECTVTDPLGQTEVHAHDLAGRLLSVTRPTGDATALDYDVEGRRNAVIDGLGNTTTRTFDPNSKFKTQSTLPDGRMVTYDLVQRTERNWLRTEIGAIHYPDGTSESFAYDGEGNIIEYMDRAGYTQAFTFDGRGRMTSMTNVAGATTTWVVDAAGTTTSTTDSLGNTISWGYDALLRRNSTTLPDGTSRSRVYDDNDRLISTTDEAGNTSTFLYDTNGNLTGFTAEDGTTTALGYDAMDRLVSRTDPNGALSIMDYDDAGRLSSVTDRNGSVVSFEYDGNGRQTARVDAAGERWTRTYETNGWLSNVTDPLGNTTSFVWDLVGRPTSVTSPTGAVSTTTYDDMGRPTREVDADGRATNYTFDERGYVASVQAPGGATATYTRNGFGDATQVVDASGDAWTFTYDALGRITSWADPAGNATSVGYDQRSRADSYTLPGAFGAVDLTYDAVGNLVAQDYGDGTALTYTYDAVGLLTATNDLVLVRDANGYVVQSDGIASTRDPGGRIQTVSYPAGDVSYTYDTGNRLVQVTDWLGNDTMFDYDAVGRLTAVTRPNGIDTAVTYDAAGAITAIDEDDSGTSVSSIALQRSASGNIVSAQRDVPTVITLPADDTFTSGLGGQIGQATYDQLGRLTTDGTRGYTWDAASRLLGHDDGSNPVTYTYNGLFQVTSRTQGGVTTSYVWNHATLRPTVPVIQEGGTDAFYYVYTPSGELLYGIDAATNAAHFFHFDEMGSTLFLTDDSGAVTDTYAYTAFGLLTDSTGTTANPFTYQGRNGVMQDGDSGLYLMGRRFYDSGTQRFISAEPIRHFGHPSFLNVYAYAMGNPLRWIDPTGETNEPPKFNPNETEEQVIQYAVKPAVALVTAGAEDAKAATGLIAQVTVDSSPETAKKLLKVHDKLEGATDALGNIGGGVTLLEGALHLVKDGDPLSQEGLKDAGMALSGDATEIVTKTLLKKKLGEELAGAAGGAAKKVLGVGIEAYKMREKVKEEMKSLRSGLQSDLAIYYLVTDLTWEAYRKKLIDRDELERRLIEAKETFEMSRKGSYKAGTTNVKIELLRGLQGMLESML